MREKALAYMALVTVLAAFAAGCSKDGGVDCFMSTGDIVTEARYVGPFHRIEVHDNIHLNLAQDTNVNSLQVEAGENLMPGIVTLVEQGCLYIRNENRCNWMRSFDIPVNVYISFSRLDSIIYRAAGGLAFTTPWKNDSIQFDIWEGAGTVVLPLDVFKSRVYVHYGVADVRLSGYSQVSYISNNGYGPVDALGLQTKFTYLGSGSPNDCYVWVMAELGATIHNIGNVYYKGNPSVIQEVATNSGRLIRLE